MLLKVAEYGDERARTGGDVEFESEFEFVGLQQAGYTLTHSILPVQSYLCVYHIAQETVRKMDVSKVS